MGDDEAVPDAAAAEDRPLRADARRNRERVLRVAQEVFAAEGLSVPVHEIARRAGVGTGTVSRHFPSKQSLFQAILVERLRGYVRKAGELAETGDPDGAFFAFFSFMVLQGAMDRGLAEALSGSEFDVSAAAADSDYDVMGALHTLLRSAQQSGAVRADIELADVKAILVGCLSRSADPGDSGAGQRRLVEIAREGMRAEHS